MATIITRETGATAKGSPLTNAEVDNNFINLNTEVTPIRPTIRPSLDLDFTNARAVDHRIKSRRNSKASYYDKDGVLKQVGNTIPRITYNPNTGEVRGLLNEDQRTNYFYSTAGGELNWNFEYDGYPIRKAAVAPDGTMSALLLKTKAGSGSSARMITSIPSAGTWTVSWYVKQGASANFSMWVYSGGWVVSQGFTWSSGILSADSVGPKLTSVGNGWYRVEQTFTTPGSGSLLFSPGYYGNPSLSSSTYYWGIQLEAGAFATSYVSSYDSFASRDSSATYFDSTGVMRTAGKNQARYGYGYDSANAKWVPQGLIVEEARTNWVSQSIKLSTWANNSGSMVVTDNYTTAPDGSTTASKVVARAVNENHFIYTSVTNTGTIYSWSAYVKAGGHNYAIIHAHGITQNVFDLTTGTWVGSQPGDILGRDSQNVGNGWYRICITYTAQSGNVYIGGSPVNNTYTYTGDGTNGIYIWGAQVEEGAFPTSFIYTKGAAAARVADSSGSAQVTRAFDNYSISADENSKILGENGFSFLFEFYRDAGNARSGFYEHSVGVGGAQMFIDPYGDANMYWIFAGGGGQGALGTLNATGLNKYAASITYSGNGVVSWNNSAASLATSVYASKSVAKAWPIGLGNNGYGGNASCVTGVKSAVFILYLI